MITIVGCNKGGSGKTTTSTNIAIGLAQRGHDVVIVDADRQRSMSTWYADRDEAEIEPKLTLIEKRDNISSTLKSLDEKYDHVIVDVAGRNSREMITGATVADIVVAPHQASQFDLDTLAELEEQIVRIRDLNPGLEVFVYQAMASTNAQVKETERAEFIGYVEEFESFKPLKSVGYYRKVYRDVASTGMSVLESDNDQAKEEILNLIGEVYGS